MNVNRTGCGSPCTRRSQAWRRMETTIRCPVEPGPFGSSVSSYRGPPITARPTCSPSQRFRSGSRDRRVRLPAPEGERLSDAEARRIKARRDGVVRTSTIARAARWAGFAVSGPVTSATPAQLARSVRDSLEAYGGAQNTILRVNCFDGTRCDAVFTISGRRLEMSYRIQALKSVPTCWELTAFQVVRARAGARATSQLRCQTEAA